MAGTEILNLPIALGLDGTTWFPIQSSTGSQTTSRINSQLITGVQATLDSITNVQGSILYRGATAWAGLGPSTAGFVLQTGGPAANPSWVDITVGTAANRALSNLASVAINTSLLPGVTNTIDLGSTARQWNDLFLGSGGIINFNNGGTTLTNTGATVAARSSGAFNPPLQISSLDNTSGSWARFDIQHQGGGAPWFMYQDSAGTGTNRNDGAFPFRWSHSGTTIFSVESTTVSPGVNDARPLGTASVSWADLFLATDGVINWANGNVTQTHSTGALSFNGTSGARLVVTYNGADGNSALFLNASGSSIDNSPAMNIVLPASGARKAFVIANTGDALGWSSFEYNNGSLGPGFSLGPGGATARDVFVYRAGTATLGLGVGAAGEALLTSTAFSPAVNDGNALGTTSLMWGDLFLASGGVINWNNGDVTITHSTNTLSFDGAASGYNFTGGKIVFDPGAQTDDERSFRFNIGGPNFARLLVPSGSGGALSIWTGGADAAAERVRISPTGVTTFTNSIMPAVNDGSALGTTSLMWADLFLANGGVVNWNNASVTFTHSGSTIIATTSSAFGPPITINSLDATSGSWARLDIRHQGGGGAWFMMQESTGVCTSRNDIAQPFRWQHSGTNIFVIDAATVSPGVNDGRPLGTGSVSWADLFLASGGVINFNNGNITLTHASGTLIMEGGTLQLRSGAAAGGFVFGADVNASTITNSTRHIGRMVIPAYNTAQVPFAFFAADANSGENAVEFGGVVGSASVQAATRLSFLTAATVNTTGGTETFRVASGVCSPGSSDGSSLGSTSIMWSDLFLASGALINFNNGNVVLTHNNSGMLGISTGAFGRGAPVTKTADFTLGASENWIINNKSGSACVATLPAASSWTGREVMMKTIQAQAINSNASNVVPKAGGAAGTAIVTNTAGNWATLVSDGTNWVIMAGT